jgi:hypothetical protein
MHQHMEAANVAAKWICKKITDHDWLGGFDRIGEKKHSRGDEDQVILQKNKYQQTTSMSSTIVRLTESYVLTNGIPK